MIISHATVMHYNGSSNSFHSTIGCSQCDEFAATLRCIQCHRPLCPFCSASIHESILTPHDLVPLKNALNSSSTSYASLAPLIAKLKPARVRNTTFSWLSDIIRRVLSRLDRTGPQYHQLPRINTFPLWPLCAREARRTHCRATMRCVVTIVNRMCEILRTRRVQACAQCISHRRLLRHTSSDQL